MTFQFKIQLTSIADPPVWRRLQVPEQFSFLRMHHVIQAAFGWENYHLFQFSQKGYASHPSITIPMEEDEFLFGGEKPLHANKVKLNEIFTAPKQKFTYIYDFGDDWVHIITLEKILEIKSLRAACTDGMGACPPEDCGGPLGYENLKTILNDPKHPEHAETKEWLGMSKKQKWNVEAFDLEKTRALVAKA